MAEFTVQVKDQDVTFTSTLADGMAHLYCERIDTPFAKSLASKQLKFLSPKQIAWCHKLAVDYLAAKDKAVAAAAAAVAANAPAKKFIMAAVESLTHAGQFLAYPKIELPIGDFDANDKLANVPRLRLQLAGAKSKYRGSVSLVIRGGTLHNTYIGRIDDTAGELMYTPSMVNNVSTVAVAARALLDNLSTDFEGTVKALGKKLGHCLFCMKRLTDVRSQAVGCGAICAGHYSIQYPTFEEAIAADTFALNVTAA